MMPSETSHGAPSASTSTYLTSFMAVTVLGAQACLVPPSASCEVCTGSQSTHTHKPFVRCRSFPWQHANKNRRVPLCSGPGAIRAVVQCLCNKGGWMGRWPWWCGSMDGRKYHQAVIHICGGHRLPARQLPPTPAAAQTPRASARRCAPGLGRGGEREEKRVHNAVRAAREERKKKAVARASRARFRSARPPRPLTLHHLFVKGKRACCRLPPFTR